MTRRVIPRGSVTGEGSRLSKIVPRQKIIPAKRVPENSTTDNENTDLVPELEARGSNSSVQYPAFYESKHPVEIRKAIKLINVIVDDWLNYSNGDDDVEWVPEYIEVNKEQYAEDDGGKKIENNFRVKISVENSWVSCWILDNMVETGPFVEEHDDVVILGEWVKEIERIVTSCEEGETYRIEEIYEEDMGDEWLEKYSE